MLSRLSATVVYPTFALVGIIGFVIGGNLSSRSTTNHMLKLCNQKPLECKFRYDILMYDETGRVPYTTPKQVTKEIEKK